jgi:hypothetical protein
MGSSDSSVAGAQIEVCSTVVGTRDSDLTTRPGRSCPSRARRSRSRSSSPSQADGIADHVYECPGLAHEAVDAEYQCHAHDRDRRHDRECRHEVRLLDVFGFPMRLTGSRPAVDDAKACSMREFARHVRVHVHEHIARGFPGVLSAIAAHRSQTDTKGAGPLVQQMMLMHSSQSPFVL